MALTSIAVAGVAASIYLTIVHYTPVPLVCSTSGLINCERVLSSAYSSVAGVPISVGGLIWFAISGVMAAFALRPRGEPGWLQPAQVVWSLLGLATVLYLAGVEALAVGAICAWCTALHVLILATLVLSILRSPNVLGTEYEPAAARRR